MEDMSGDWRLLSGAEELRGSDMQLVLAHEITEHLPQLTHCALCWDRPADVPKEYREEWFVKYDRTSCLCGKCFADFREYLGLREIWYADWYEEWE